MIGLRRAFASSLTATGILACVTVAAPAQAPTGFAGFGADNKGPIQIEARELEVRDKEGLAVFTGDVTVRQGDTTLQTPKLIVHYARAAGGSTGAQPAAVGGGQDIERLEAAGKVLVTSKDQSATGDAANYDAKGQLLELNGNVVLTQGKNVVRGDRLVVNLDTGVARVLSTKNRVQMLLSPNDAQRAKSN
jgi:lipopolysaccharide export system protein LptA